MFMDLYKEILINVLAKENLQIIFPNLKIDSTKIVELECYKALQKIKALLQDDHLTDEDCFMKIEEVICLFEALNSNSGNRHDFG